MLLPPLACSNFILIFCFRRTVAEMSMVSDSGLHKSNGKTNKKGGTHQPDAWSHNAKPWFVIMSEPIIVLVCLKALKINNKTLAF